MGRVARAVRACESLKLEKVAMLVPSEKDTGLAFHELVQKAVINIYRASYAFALKPQALRYVPVTIPDPTPQNPNYSYATRNVSSDYYNFNT